MLNTLCSLCVLALLLSLLIPLPGLRWLAFVRFRGIFCRMVLHFRHPAGRQAGSSERLKECILTMFCAMHVLSLSEAFVEGRSVCNISDSFYPFYYRNVGRHTHSLKVPEARGYFSRCISSAFTVKCDLYSFSVCGLSIERKL